MARTLLLVGPRGVSGSAIRLRLAADPNIRLITVSRRVDSDDDVDAHHSVDLLDAECAINSFATLGEVTELVFAGYAPRSTESANVAPNVAMLTNTFDALHAAGANLRRVVLITGGKSYGQHLGPYLTPARESDPRILGPMFYNDQEDVLVDRSRRDGFGWTVLRPDVIIGFAVGSPMSMINCLGVYAAMCKQLKVPFRFPGAEASWLGLTQFTDARILASAAHWALEADTSQNQIFNVTNGDLVRWCHLWRDIATVFDVATAPPLRMSLQIHLGDRKSLWSDMTTEHGLTPIDYPAMVNWSFADEVMGRQHDSVHSTIKIRQAGFADCVDSHASIVDRLTDLRHEKVLP